MTPRFPPNFPDASTRRYRLRRWGICLALATQLVSPTPPVSFAKDATENEIMKGIYNSFDIPYRDLLKKKHSSEWRNLLDGFSGGFSFDVPLTQSKPQSSQGSHSQGQRTASNMTLQASVKYNPLSYWFVAATYYRYLNESLQAPWNPDFSYVFGYDDWHPYTFSLTYANYTGNRLFPDNSRGEKFSRFEQGSISLGWKFPHPKVLERLFIVHPTGGISHSINVNLTPVYTDLASASEKHWKHSISLSTKFTIYKWLYANATIFFYPTREQQQPWDPDFTYGFGYFDWHPGTISIQYNNYSGNRFPWRTHAPGTGEFTNGSITISWSWVM